MVEEFLKALKTGFNFEKRQLESYDALQAALGIFLPIAVQLLAIRYLSRGAPNEASTQLTTEQMTVLRAVARKPLSKTPTHREVCWAIAALAGHLINNGEPRWIILGRGLAKLLVLLDGWRAAQRSEASEM